MPGRKLVRGAPRESAGEVNGRAVLVLVGAPWYNFTRTVAPAQDEGFHEIQLNGKQLVFLFMAATVVSVVIFLCGVLVGRGVRAERANAVADQSAASIEPAPQTAAAPVSTPAGSDPTAAAAPPPTADDLSYFNRLEKQTQSAENLKPGAPAAAPPPPAPPSPVKEPPASAR